VSLHQPAGSAAMFQKKRRNRGNEWHKKFLLD
jgi:hypothetical protein